MKETPSSQEKVRYEIKRPWNSETKKPVQTPSHAKEDQDKMNAIRGELTGIPVIALIMEPPTEKPPKDKPESITEKIIDLILTIFEKTASAATKNNSLKR
jgi:hypothetical protein